MLGHKIRFYGEIWLIILKLSLLPLLPGALCIDDCRELRQEYYSLLCSYKILTAIAVVAALIAFTASLRTLKHEELVKNVFWENELIKNVFLENELVKNVFWEN